MTHTDLTHRRQHIADLSPPGNPHRLIPANLLANTSNSAPTYLRRAAVSQRTGLPCSTLYRYIERGLFPRPYRLGPNTVAWLATDVDSWCATRPQIGGRRHG